MSKHDALEAGFDRAIARATGPGQQSDSHPEQLEAMGYLGKAIVRLDKTSARLAKVNIGLTVVLLIAAIVQIVLMFRGK